MDRVRIPASAASRRSIRPSRGTRQQAPLTLNTRRAGSEPRDQAKGGRATETWRRLPSARHAGDDDVIPGGGIHRIAEITISGSIMSTIPSPHLHDGATGRRTSSRASSVIRSANGSTKEGRTLQRAGGRDPPLQGPRSLDPLACRSTPTTSRSSRSASSSIAPRPISCATTSP